MISQIILNDIEKEKMTNIWLNKIQQTVITKSNKRLASVLIPLPFIPIK